MSIFHFTPACASDAGFDIEPLNELRLFLTAAVANGNLPGVVVLLARGDKVVLHEAIGHGDLASAAPLRADALFRIYSMTKPLTAVAMLLLHEEGRWNFDDPVAQHLPEFEGFERLPGSRASRGPTLREIFTHTGGNTFGDTPDEMMANVEKLDLDGRKSLTDIVGAFAKVPPGYEPGTKWSYNIGMDLQASIVERTSGQRFDRFMAERVFGPLGMSDIGFALSHAQIARLVPGYAMDAETHRLRPGNAFEMQDPIFPMGGTSFRSTALEYARFARMLLNRGSLGGVRVLKPESVDLLLGNLLSEDFLRNSYATVNYMIGGGNGHGMNGMVCIDPVAAGRPVGRGTYEWGGAHGTWFWADPEHDIVCVGMTNRLVPHPEIEPLHIVAQKLVYRALRR